METICIPPQHNSAQLPPLSTPSLQCIGSPPSLSFSPSLLLLLPLVFSSSPPAPLSYRCSSGTEGTSKCVSAHMHACTYTSTLCQNSCPLIPPLKKTTAAQNADNLYYCLSNAIEQSLPVFLLTFRWGLQQAQREPGHQYQLRPVN